MKPTIALLLALGAAGLTGCGHEAETKVEAAKKAPTPVKTMSVEASTWPRTYEVTGTVEARTSAVLSAKVMGYVRELRPQVGDRVRQGEPVVLLEARDLEAGIDQAKAAVNAAREGRLEAENGLIAARSQFDLAQKTFGRMSELHEKKSVSEQEFDEASARLKAAEAHLQMAESRKSQLEARIRQAEAALASAQVNASYATVYAPFDGVVTVRHADPGTLAAPGAPLLTVERSGAFRVEAPVEESQIGQIRQGQAVRVRLDALDRELEARVSEIVPTVDPASRAFTVRINLPNLPGLRSGLFVHAGFPLGEQSGVAVPREAVVERGQLTSVYVLADGHARQRLVTLGEPVDGRRVVLSGLSPGEQIVVGAPATLADGDPVEVRP